MAATDRRYGARPVTRPSLGRAVMLTVLTWGAAVAFVLMVAADTRLGPVVFRLTKTHGVHLGDIYATLGCAVVALLITVWIAVDHMGRKRRWASAQRRAEREQAAAARYAEEDADDYADDYDAEYIDDYADEYADEYVDEGYEPAAGHDDSYEPEPRRHRHEADPDLDETVFIRRPDDLNGRHRQRH